MIPYFLFLSESSNSSILPSMLDILHSALSGLDHAGKKIPLRFLI
jgi:hypothetical protein